MSYNFNRWIFRKVDFCLGLLIEYVVIKTVTRTVLDYGTKLSINTKIHLIKLSALFRCWNYDVPVWLMKLTWFSEVLLIKARMLAFLTKKPWLQSQNLVLQYTLPSENQVKRPSSPKLTKAELVPSTSVCWGLTLVDQLPSVPTYPVAVGNSAQWSMPGFSDSVTHYFQVPTRPVAITHKEKTKTSRSTTINLASHKKTFLMFILPMFIVNKPFKHTDLEML